MDALELDFIALSDLLSHPESWTQGQEAEDWSEVSCEPLEDGARAWCLYGGVRKVTGDDLDRMSPILSALADAIRGDDESQSRTDAVMDFNDWEERTRAEVLDLILRARIGAAL